MGYSACFGGPLFNLLLGIGIPFSVAFVKNGGAPIAVEYNAMVLTLCAAFAVAIMVSFIVMPLSGFRDANHQTYLREIFPNAISINFLTRFVSAPSAALSRNIFLQNILYSPLFPQYD
jgi:hypothetical protein